MREKKKKKGKSGEAGPPVVSCWPLYEVMDFLRDTVKHERLISFVNFMDINFFLQHCNKFPKSCTSNSIHYSIYYCVLSRPSCSKSRESPPNNMSEELELDLCDT